MNHQGVRTAHDIQSPDRTVNSLPGGIVFHKDLESEILKMEKGRGQNYKPRTRHLDPSGQARYTNRLFLQSSPYLLQHAHNPVNWYPWGDEAFSDAKKLHRPVFLSVGYSTCHWCHVMEEESFEDEEIAQCLNENFIAIKVDREERPDIDAVYMNAVQAITGGGGWPLNVFLTPEKVPFYGGTYYPARDGDRGAGAGFLTILKALSGTFHTQKEKIEGSGNAILSAIKGMAVPSSGAFLPTADKIHQAVSFFKQQFDKTFGGVKGNMKFPSSLSVRLLLRYYRRTGDGSARHMAVHTLDKMADGGINDHIGGGFHRYATDEKWLVPHFEKMLYDNALLALCYLEAFQITGNQRFEKITRRILDYVAREMTAPTGGFYSATDADSMTPSGHREEGYYFTWRPEEIDALLGKDESRIVRSYFSVGAAPNFEGRYILHTPVRPDKVAERNHITVNELEEIIESAIPLLYRQREKRERPLRDDKILTAWNGLMISAFARAGFAFDSSFYRETAINAASFILHHLVESGRLLRSYNDGKASHNAYLEDYAFFIASLIDLYESTSDIIWLEKAIYFQSILHVHYGDDLSGGFFMTSHDHETLIAREKPAFDNAMPSGNSVAILNMLRLYGFTDNNTYRIQAENAFQTFLGSDTVNPVAFSEMLIALDYFLDSPKEITIVSANDSTDDAAPFLDVLRNRFLPNAVRAVVKEKDIGTLIERSISSVQGKQAINGNATAYVCEGGTCDLPSTTLPEFIRQIEKTERY
ncbi:MAG: thioredoxin domain-containing protein [Proteobacteria bacterium]|nr:thioredoxin domain-containing protein [Pseudomonadota bacterium]